VRVCFLIGDFPVYSGVSSQAVLQARELIELGVDVELGIIVRENGVLACSDIFDPKLLPSSLKCTFLPALHNNKKIIKEYIRFFLKAKKEFDIVHFHGIPVGCTILAIVFKLLGLKVIVKMTGLGINDPRSLRNKKWGLFNSLIFSVSDIIIGTSKALRDAYISAGFSEKKLSYIPNGVDCSRFSPLSNFEEKERLKKKLNLDKKKVALFVGSFRTAKGVDLLIDSFCKVRNTVTDLQLVIVGPICPVCPGSGIAEEKLMLKIKDSLKIIMKGNQVLILGQDRSRFSLVGTKRNIEEWMAAADVFLFPSRREGLPNVVLEAMASALPCVTLNIPEITGDLLIDDSLGWCVRDNEDCFAEAILDIFSNPEKAAKRAAEAAKRANKIFSSKIVAKKLKLLYTEVKYYL